MSMIHSQMQSIVTQLSLEAICLHYWKHKDIYDKEAAGMVAGVDAESFTF